MFVCLISLTALVIVLGAAYTYKRTRDVLHPAMLILPMFGFIYVWMPLKLWSDDILAGYFYPEQLLFVQTINMLGVLTFVLGAASINAGRSNRGAPPAFLSEAAERKLMVASLITGAIGFAAWLLAIRNVGGIAEAFSHPYSGGWDDSGYIRDGSLLMFSAVVLAMPVLTQGRRRFAALALVGGFLLPWAFQAVFTSRRGPAFMVCVVLTFSWFYYRRRRPSLPVVAAAALVVGYGILLLVVNRNRIYWGSDFELTSNVDSYVKTGDGSNEYIYGGGSIVDSYVTGKHYWGRRYLAQVVVRPIPSAIWPTKYEDFGVAELLKNAGNSTTFANTLGWSVPPGAAPGIVADLWMEVSWGALLALFFAGRTLAWIWRRAISEGGLWTAQYCICAALTIYFVMQTMEAVIFRFLLLSVPLWLAWNWAKRPSSRRAHTARKSFGKEQRFRFTAPSTLEQDLIADR
jgi:hypothetical protein